MASKLYVRKSKHLLARVATKSAPCGFCRSDVDDELIYGKLYAIGDIHCHYFCVLLSCCLIQKGRDTEGLFGFLYPDILAEIERSKKHRCSYCSQEGATLGCSVTQCKKQFHLPCGRRKNAVSMFHGNYKTYCQHHAPKQKIPNNIMDKIKERKHRARKLKSDALIKEICDDSQEMVCVICYERVDAFPTLHTFWPPCCARDAWFHRSCLQRMALSAGVHYLKCPLCNDKEQFYGALLSQGYYIPDRDAAWELEQNAFAEIYERTVVCDAPMCECPNGREYDLDNSPWDIKVCLLCGSVAAHARCAAAPGPYVCPVCRPAAPDDPAYLEAIDAMTLPDPSQTATRSRHGPIMPSRMSLRRTKPRINGRNIPSSSNAVQGTETKMIIETGQSQNTLQSREELNLKPPKRQLLETKFRNVENQLLSPIKLLEQRLCEKLEEMKLLDTFVWDSGEVIDLMRQKLKRPTPLAVRKKILNTIIDNVLTDMLKTKVKEPTREWNSPKKCCKIVDANNIAEENLTNQEFKDEFDNSKSDVLKTVNNLNPDLEINLVSSKNNSNILTEEFLDKNLPIICPKSKSVVIQDDSAMEISENNEKIDIDFVNIKQEASKKVVLKFSPIKEVLEEKNIDVDLESFKNHYLSEVDRDSKANRIDYIPEAILNEQSNSTSTKTSASTKIKKNKKFKKSATDNKFKNSAADEKYKNSTTDKKYRNSTTDKKYKKSSTDKKYSNNEDKDDLVFKFTPDVASKNKRRKKKRGTEFSIRDKNIRVNIKWKKEQLKLKITNSKKKKQKFLKQYVLENSRNSIVMAPGEVSPSKRKYKKKEKSTDHLKQTSIENFFKLKTSDV